MNRAPARPRRPTFTSQNAGALALVAMLVGACGGSTALRDPAPSDARPPDVADAAAPDAPALDVVDVVDAADVVDAVTVAPDAGNITLGPGDPAATVLFTVRVAPSEVPADVFFVVDNSASLTPLIAGLRNNLSSVIVPGIRAAFPDLRIGVASFDSLPTGLEGSPGAPGDYGLWVRQPLTADNALVQAALDHMHTIDVDTAQTFFGGDYAECQTEALYELVAGTGSLGHESDEAARRTVHNALDASGDGWIPAVDTARDCPAGSDPARTFGWGCFTAGRLPVVVLFSDAAWYNGFAPSSDAATPMPVDLSAATFPQLVSAMQNRAAYFVGIDVGGSGDTYRNSLELARQTGTLDALGAPVAFHPGPASDSVARDLVTAVGTIASAGRQDVSTAVDPDPAETRLVAGHSTADFVQSVTPTAGVPGVPEGYARSDAAGYYSVAPGTQLGFAVTLANTFQPRGAVAQTFVATVRVVGRGGVVLERRAVSVVVPAR